MKVLVYMPTYNRFESVITSVQSFLKQDYENKELIIQNNDTTGEMLKVLTDWFQNESNITIIQSDNKNQIKGFNEVWRNTDADLICELHDDDSFYNEQSISIRVTEFEADKDLEMVYAGVNEIERGEHTIRPSQNPDVNKLLTNEYINVTTMMWRASVRDKFMIHEGLYYNTDLLLKIQFLKECKVKNIDEIVMNYGISKSQFTFTHRHLYEKENIILKEFIKTKYGI